MYVCVCVCLCVIYKHMWTNLKSSKYFCVSQTIQLNIGHLFTHS